VLLDLGPSTVDVADRALVVAVLPPGTDQATRVAVRGAVDEGADVVELPVDVVELAAGVPVAVRTADLAAARDALAAGAMAIAPVRVEGDAAAVVAALWEEARALAAAGLDPRRVAVEPVANETTLALPPARGLRCVGVPVVVSVVRPDASAPDPDAVAAPLSVAAVRGYGLLRVAAADVRSARRVADVIAAVRRARP
jgi:hypothetical protein